VRLVLAVVLGLSLAAIAQLALPPVARVTDQTGTLSAEQKASLERLLEAFEKRKGSQIAVVMVKSTSPEAIEQYAECERLLLRAYCSDEHLTPLPHPIENLLR